jgi:hypothetical protein
MEGRAALIVSLVAAMAVAGGGLYFILEQGVPIPETKGDTPASAPSPSSIEAPPATPPVAPSIGAETKAGPAIYRCQKGRSVTYSDSPCEGGKVVNVQDTRGYEAPRAVASPPTSVATPEPSAPAMSPTVNEAARPAECKRLEELIAWIDSEARQGGATGRIEELREQRRKAVERRNELRC